jgi:hypothetical protein
MSEINILPGDKPMKLGDEEYLAIARLKTSMGGKSLLKVCEAYIKSCVWQLVKTDPNDVGAVAQLQSQIACYHSIRNLIITDEENYRHVINEEK